MTKQPLLVLAQLYFVASLVVPMLMPAGMMLSRNSDSNVVELTICSATDPRTVFINIETGALLSADPFLTGNPEAPEHHPDQDICPFDLATNDQLSLAKVEPDATPALPAKPALTANASQFFSQKHPSIPPRSPPWVA